MAGYPDKSLYYGQQNFVFVESFTGSSVSGDTNDYVIYMDRKGMILIAQFSAAGDKGRYLTKAGDYDTIVAARGTYDYVLPNQLIDISL